MARAGFRLGRLKTGTPPRLDGRTIDVPDLGSVLVRADGAKDGVFELTPTASSPVKSSWTGRLGAPRAHVPPGRYRLSVTEVGGTVDSSGRPRRGTADVVVVDADIDIFRYCDRNVGGRSCRRDREDGGPVGRRRTALAGMADVGRQR